MIGTMTLVLTVYALLVEHRVERGGDLGVHRAKTGGGAQKKPLDDGCER